MNLVVINAECFEKTSLKMMYSGRSKSSLPRLFVTFKMPYCFYSARANVISHMPLT